MDSKVFMQSRNLMFKATYLYHVQRYSQRAIAHELKISVSTVSRLLSKAQSAGVVELRLDPLVEETVLLERELSRCLGIREVIVAPSKSTSPLNSRLAVALEGARYLQNAITDGSVLGMGFGGTIKNLVHYLNPCKKVNTNFVMLHGKLPTPVYQQDMEEAIACISNAFGGKRYMLDCDVYIPNEGAYQHVMSRFNTRQVMALYDRVTISVSGIGALNPVTDSFLVDPACTECPEITAFIEKRCACGDIFLNFFDENGAECYRNDNIHMMSISFAQYRKIATKILVVPGVKKIEALLAALRGGLADVLIIDIPLAAELLRRFHEGALTPISQRVKDKHQS